MNSQYLPGLRSMVSEWRKFLNYSSRMVDERQNFNSGCKFWGWQSEMGTKGEVNWGKSIYSDDLLIIYKKHWGNIQFQSILHHLEPKYYKRFQNSRLVLSQYNVGLQNRRRRNHEFGKLTSKFEPFFSKSAQHLIQHSSIMKSEWFPGLI